MITWLRSLRCKITLAAGLCTLLVTVFFIHFSTSSFKQRTRLMTTQHAIDLVQAKAAVISQKIEEVFFTVRSMAHVLAQTQNPGSDLDIRRKHVNTMLKACLEKNLGLTRIYTCWEPDAFDALDVNYVNTKGHDGTGRFIPCWERQANGRMRLLPMPFYNNEDQSDSGQRLGEFYLHPRETKKECILESGSPTGSRTISLVVPIMAHNSFYGITGIDITSDFLQTLVNNLYADEDTGTWQLISHHHTILGHTQQPQLIGSRALDLSDQDAQDPSIKHHDNVIVNNHRSLLSVQIPIPIGQTETPWYVRWEIPYNQIHAEVNTYLWHQIGSGGICIFMTLLLLTLMINRLTRPMRNIITEITESHDDLTHRLHIKSKDELGELAQWINRFIDKVHSMIKHISENSTILAGAAQELSVTSTQMAQSTSKMSDDSAIVTTSVKDMSHNMDQVSQASDQMSNNIKSAAASIEELTANVSEIANNAEEAAGVATQPMNLTEMSNNKMNELVGAANEVGKVVEVIQDIAEQTNLLALNATIEAARAGDAGKGFGVVANEVKELARQTAEATEDITRMISGIQDTTGDSVKAIHRIQKVINEVNDVSNAIATAVEQQSITTREISNNVSHTARASETVAKGLSESATVGREITTNIANVDETATMSAEAATQTRRASEELLELSKQLTNLVSGFKI